MKKVIFALSLCAAGSAMAGTAVPADGIVTSAACTLITESVTARLSANVKGGYACDTTTGFIGIGTANTAGKGKSFGAGNKGGSITAADCASVATAAQNCANTAADTAAAT